MGEFELFFNWAEENQWKLEKRKENAGGPVLPDELIQRYGEIPADYGEFLEAVESLSNKGKTAWFLCEDDFKSDTPAYACRWNEPELMSIDAAQGDEALVEDIKHWWDRRLPVVMLRNGKTYEYYALDFDNGCAVVCGSGPQFEDVKPAASSFSEFLAKIMRGEITL